jgi:putative DNA primase/helicase
LTWDGRRWALDSSAEVVRLAKETVRNIYREAADTEDSEARKATVEWARKSEKNAAIVAMMKLAESEPGVPVQPDALDADPWLLNCQNGTINLRTGELQPHRKGDLLTKLAPVEYGPAAGCPRWKQFLCEVFAPHPDLMDFIQRAVGYSLTGDTREECLFLLHGTGRNGKGTFIRTLCRILGDYAATADFGTFVSKRDEGPRDDVANMKGRHFIAAQESREGAALAESIVKTLTGGDLVRARRLYENSYEFLPTHKLWLATNHRPAIKGTDPAIWSRIKLVPFEVSFEGREDRGLKAALEQELPGVLAWAVEGCLRWQEDGLQFPDAVRQATAEYRNENDQLGRFIDDCCVVGDFVRCKATPLYTAYRRWADETGEDPLTLTAFGRRMTERGFRKEKKESANVYVGIGERTQGGDAGGRSR